MPGGRGPRGVLPSRCHFKKEDLMEQSHPQSTASNPDPVPPLLQDLAVLCDGPVLDLQIAFDRGLIAMRSNDKLIYQESAEARWMRLGGAARAKLVASWIHVAALKYRSLLATRLGEPKPEVA
jgi:hypothetical protein